tara:strand:+ start:22215 stop:24443 length:2229 start_codon:yes stop_codon:yes gene_type:complete
MKKTTLILVSFLVWSLHSNAQKIASDKVLSNQELSSYLTKKVQKDLKVDGTISIEKLANYFRVKFSERYFYDWQTNENRFQEYVMLYPESKGYHIARAKDHMDKFPAKSEWKLPFNYQNGKPVNAYALRHLARQHKMIDIGYNYFYENKNEQYLDYFTTQLASLNSAFAANQYEIIEDGNGVYEAFRSGYRIINWLQLHNLFLGQSGYSDQEQLVTIATFLQHAQHLYERNQIFKSGNHQTRGLCALAMLSILLRDFEGADLWYKHAMTLLGEHLEKEINDDGFQFERTIHYHISDIGTYFYVYQIAKKSNLNIDATWQAKLKSLFSTLTKVAFPDKSAPVLSDDTDAPWAEKNDISGAMTLGYLLFEDPEIGYFAKDKLSTKFYWNASALELGKLKNIQALPPKELSYVFPETGYYILREGWGKNDKMMVISAGVDALKPDHQHGDILGIQAMANGQVVLPNYQVRYSLKDLELFKNSMTKNVALVDNELLGKKYTSNKGGSGFGKFKQLPKPKVITFNASDDLDVFVASHNGFENLGVTYTRQVINVSNDFWIVKDNFSSAINHEYKQVWQGHYSLENGSDLLRSSFNDGSGFDIFQLNKTDKVLTDGARGKHWSVISKTNQNNFRFVTVLYPFKTYDKRINEGADRKEFSGWVVNHSKWKKDNPEAISLTKEATSIFFSVKILEFQDIKIEFQEKVDVLVYFKNEKLQIQLLDRKEAKAAIIKKGVKQEVNCSIKVSKF